MYSTSQMESEEHPPLFTAQRSAEHIKQLHRSAAEKLKVVVIVLVDTNTCFDGRSRMKLERTSSPTSSTTSALYRVCVSNNNINQ